MSKHTDGPWSFDDDNWEVVSSDGIICELRGDNADANARLIVAAPDLLGACKQALRRTSMSDGLRDEIEAAIAKAEGKS